MKVIVISAHPDDEVLGCGGTLLKHKFNNDEIHWAIVTNIFESQGFSKERVISRQKEIHTVSQMFGFSSVTTFDYPTMSLDSSSIITLTNKIGCLFNTVQPNTIYVMNRSDAHSDHRITFDAVLACTKSFRYPYINKILMYECLSETEFAPALHEKIFIPNYFIDITPYFKKKIEIMNIYKSELSEHPFPRSFRNIEALATYRGAYAGVEYAESFQLLKYID